jgi:hypothetical protein
MVRASYPTNHRSRQLLLALLVVATLPCLGAFPEPSGWQVTPLVRVPGDQFAISVAVSAAHPAYLVAGAFRNDEIAPEAGKAYLFRRSGRATWKMTQVLVDEDGESSDHFGRAVAIGENFLAIGAPSARKDAGTPTAGAVFVYRYELGIDRWVFDGKLTASDGANGDAFGWAVAVDGGTIAVGALEKDGGQGAAYAFARDHSTGVWSEQGKLVDPDGEADDFLGVSVDVDGDTIVVGAYLDTVETVSGPVEKGSVSLFTRSGDSWTFDQKVFSRGDGRFINYGLSVALDAGVLAIGAPRDTPPFLPGQQIRVTGTVYRYDATAIDIASTQVRVWPSDKGVVGGPTDFGFSLSLDEDVLGIGAYGDGSNGSESGSAYLFDLDDNLLTESVKITSLAPVAGDVFGFTVSVSDELIAVGADREDIDEVADDNAGAAYVYSVPEADSFATALVALSTVAVLLGARRRSMRLGS